MEFVDLAKQCAPMVHVQTMTALVRTESHFNPFAIGVVGGRLVRQPRSLAEAVATGVSLDSQGYNWSGGYGQVNRHNFKRFGLTVETVFEPCRNLRASGTILAECFTGALSKFPNEQHALRGSFSCYYSGNYRTGFRPDFKGQPSYVEKVVGNAFAGGVKGAIPVFRTEAAPKEHATVRTPVSASVVAAGKSEGVSPPVVTADARKSALVF